MKMSKSYKGAALLARQLRLNHSSKQAWHFRWKPVSSSTQKDLEDWLLSRPLGQNPRACISASQRHGKGQFNRSWHSPLGGVWISVAMPCSLSPEFLGGFSLSIAVALSEIFEKKNIPVHIKWPNDLIVKGKKIAGFLPKLVFRGNELRCIQIGLGLNVLNRVPPEGISLNKVLETNQCQQVFWTAEVINAFERSIEIFDDPFWVCKEAEKRLWDSQFIDKETGEVWDIDGISLRGQLILSKGNLSKLLDGLN